MNASLKVVGDSCTEYDGLRIHRRHMIRALGYHVAATGATEMMRERLIGHLKSVLAEMRQHFLSSFVPSVHRARWFNARARAVISFYGPFLPPGVKVSEKLQTLRAWLVG